MRLLLLLALTPLSAMAMPPTAKVQLREARTLAKVGEARAAQAALSKLVKSAHWGKLGSDVQRRALLLLAKLDLSLKRPEQALKRLQKLKSPQRSVQAFIFYYRGLAELRLKRYAHAARSFRRSLAQDSGFLYWRRASLKMAQALEHAGRSRRAKAVYQALSRRVGDRWLDKPMILFRLAKLSGWPRKLVAKLATRFGHTREGSLALKRIGYGALSQQERKLRIQQLIRSWEYATAERELLVMLRKPAPTWAHYWLGVIYQRKLRTQFNAGIRLLKVVARRGGKYRESALFRIAKSYAKLEKYDDALKVYRHYIKTFPRGRHIEDAYYYLGWLPHDRHQDQRAITGFDAYLANCPKKSRKLTTVLWFRAWSLYRLKRYERAIRAFRKLLPYRNTLVGGKGLYWIGRSYERLGKPAQAIAAYRQLLGLYSLSYYPFLANRRLIALGQKSALSWLGRRPAWPRGRRELSWPLMSVSARLRGPLREIRALVEIDEIDAARAEFEKIADLVERELTRKGKLLAFFQLNVALERFHELWKWIGRRHGHQLHGYAEGQRALLFAMAYPRAYRDYVRLRARQFGIAEYVIYSVMRQESRYRVSAISHTDAMGLMQVIPKTARIIARALGVSYSRHTFFKPKANIRFAAYYLSELVKKFRGQLVFAFAGYNAGAPAMARFLDLHKGLPFDEMAEEIAYNEARNYSRKVAEHYLRYLYLYERPERREAHLLRLFPARVNYDYLSNINY